MSAFTQVAEYRAAIQAEMGSVEDSATRRTVHRLLAYAEKTAKEADNGELRPRPDGSENAAYYRRAINEDCLPSNSLRSLIRGLLDYLERLEKKR